MKFVDDSQNLRVRLRLIQVLVLLLLGVLCVRLYLLQIVNGSRYAEIAENQRIRLLPIPAPRGAILDRNGDQLVDSRPIYSVILSREITKSIDYSLITPLSDGLQLDSEILRERFDQVKSQPAFESILIKEGVTSADIAWVDAHQLEFPTLRIEQTPQRRYPENGLLCHALGYVGEISPEQLKQPEYRDKGYKPGDIIGQEGLESVYDEYLRGRDGYRKVIVDSRGHIQNEVERVEPQAGQDIVITIDLDLQKAAEEQLRKSPQGRGVIISMDPNNGEILALARNDARAANMANVEFRQADACASFRQEEFDMAYARFLLSHLQTPVNCLVAMVEACGSEGTIVIEDTDFSGTFCYPHCAAYERYNELYQEVVQRRGGDPNIGPKLPALLRRAGIQGVEFNVIQPAHIHGEGKLMAPITITRISDALIGEGLATNDEVQQILTGLHVAAADSETVMSLPRIFQVWGKRSKID